MFPGLEWGGMTSDTAIFVQSGLDMDRVEEQSQGTWRIFSKLGAGNSSQTHTIPHYSIHNFGSRGRHILLASGLLLTDLASAREVKKMKL